MTIKDDRVRTCAGEEAELLIPPHPKMHEYPQWLKELGLHRLPEYKDKWPDSASDAVTELLRQLDALDWLDHWGTAIYGGKEFWVSEPYHLNRERVDQMLRVCDSLNLAVNIQSAGHHYPSLTMRVFVWPKEWSVGDHFCQEEEGYKGQPHCGPIPEADRPSQCHAQPSVRLSGADLEIVLCTLLETGRLFAFLPPDEENFEDVMLLLAEARDSFVQEHPGWRDVTADYTRRHRQ